mgnify:FL=1
MSLIVALRLLCFFEIEKTNQGRPYTGIEEDPHEESISEKAAVSYRDSCVEHGARRLCTDGH